MRRAQRLLVVAGGACVLVACNLIAGFESDYTVSSTDSGSSSEASNEDGPSPDGSTDGPVGNDGSPDTSTDGGVDANFCAPNEAGAVYFCDDFEGAFEAGKPEGWDFVQVQAPSTISIAPTEGINGTKALKVTLLQSGQLSRTNWLRKQLGALVPHYEAEFDVRAPAPTSTLNYAALASIAFPGATQATQEDHGLATANGATFRGLGLVGSPVNDGSHVWHHVRIVLDATSGTIYSRKLVIDGVTTESSPGHDLAGPTTPEMRMGIFFTPDSATATQVILFDNFVMRQ